MLVTPLDSNRWQELSYNGHGELPVALAKLASNASHSHEELIGAMDDVNDHIFHQLSTYPATYITVPFLFDVMDRQHKELRHWIIREIAMIAGQGPPHGELTTVELEAYADALKLAGAKAEKMFRNGEYPKNSGAGLYAVFNMATLNCDPVLGHRMWYGTEEDCHVCVECQLGFVSAAYAIPYAEDVRTKEYLLSNPGDPRYLYPFQRTLNGDGEETPVEPRQAFAKDSPLAALVATIEETGNPKLALWVRYFFGSGACPDCGARVELIDEIHRA